MKKTIPVTEIMIRSAATGRKMAKYRDELSMGSVETFTKSFSIKSAHDVLQTVQMSNLFVAAEDVQGTYVISERKIISL